jgi:hypothetical protein
VTWPNSQVSSISSIFGKFCLLGVFPVGAQIAAATAHQALIWAYFEEATAGPERHSGSR